MTLDDFLKSEMDDVPVSVRLKDGSRIVFRCDGCNSTELIGSVVGADCFLPFSDIVDVEVLTEQEYEVHAKNHEVHWYR